MDVGRRRTFKCHSWEEVVLLGLSLQSVCVRGVGGQGLDEESRDRPTC